MGFGAQSSSPGRSPCLLNSHPANVHLLLGLPFKSELLNLKNKQINKRRIAAHLKEPHPDLGLCRGVTPGPHLGCSPSASSLPSVPRGLQLCGLGWARGGDAHPRAPTPTRGLDPAALGLAHSPATLCSSGQAAVGSCWAKRSRRPAERGAQGARSCPVLLLPAPRPSPGRLKLLKPCSVPSRWNPAAHFPRLTLHELAAARLLLHRERGEIRPPTPPPPG